MNHLKQKFGTIALAGLIGILSCSKPQIYDQNDNSINIKWGGYEYAQNINLKSQRFLDCSAVILDYENSAVMAHAFPGNFNSRSGFYGHLNANNVVQNLSEALLKKGIKPKDSEAIINAGSQRDLDTILLNLKERGIKVRESSVARPTNPIKERERDIIYNPVSNELKVVYHF